MTTKECIISKKENKNTIKKVEINTESLQNAIKISQNIKINEKYEPNFSYILKNEPITKSELKQDEISSCELTEENYILCKYRDIGSETIFDFLSKNTENTNIIRYILDFHTLLVDSIKELNKTGIIHLDIREENIVITNEQIPVITNFTQAIIKSEVKLKGKSNSNWCIEAIIYEKIEDMDSKIIQPDFFESLNIQSENQTLDGINEKMIGKTIEELKTELLISINTWDVYSIYVMFWKLMDKLNIQNETIEKYKSIISDLIKKNTIEIIDINIIKLLTLSL